jgi:hypothetical protein
MLVKPWVNHDRLDDEVIAIDLNSGAYYAFEGAAADTWTLLLAGLDPAAIGTRLAERYEVTPLVAAADVARFFEELLAQGLVEAGGELDKPAGGPPPPSGPTERAPYVAPTIEHYDDLADLFALDPIHEVDNAGWPRARRGEAS